MAAADSSTAIIPSADLVRSYLRDIGRVPLLSHEQEITLGRQVQDLIRLEEVEIELKMRAGGQAPSQAQWAQALGLSQPVLKRKLACGRRAKGADGGRQPAPGGERGEEIHQAEHGAARPDPGGHDRSGARR